MVSQAARLAARGGNHVHVEVAVVIAGVGDHRAIRRIVRAAGEAGAGHQALGFAAGATDCPDVSAKGESNLGLAECGALQKQRPGIRRKRQDGSEKHGKACQSVRDAIISPSLEL